MSEDPYNDLLRTLFANTAHAGIAADAVSVTQSEQGVRIEMSASCVDDVIKCLRFRAWGCPHLIAACEAVCAEFEGQTASQLKEFRVADLMQRLAVPAAKSGRIIVLEDTVRLLGEALRESSQSTEQD